MRSVLCLELCETGGAFTHLGVIAVFISDMDGLCSGSQGGGITMIVAMNGPFDLELQR